MRAITIPIGLTLVLLAVSVLEAQETFENPEIDGRRLDLCLVWGGQCGKPAADGFCRERGFDAAREWKPAFDIGAATPTLVLTDRRLCDAPGCDGFATITCGAAPRTLRPLPAAERLRPIRPSPPPEPGRAEPADVDEPVTEAAPAVEPWTTQDVIDERIDVQAQYALMRMFVGEPAERAVASGVLAAIEAGALAGVYREDQRAPALRARALGTGWWMLVPRGRAAACVIEPDGELPLIAVRRGAHKDPAAYDRALAEAWEACGLPASEPRPYVETLPPRPTSAETGCAYPQADGQLNVQVYDADTGDPLEGIAVLARSEDMDDARYLRGVTDLMGYVVVAPAAEGRWEVAAMGKYEGGEQVRAAVLVFVDLPADCRRTVYIPLPPWEEPFTPDPPGSPD